MKVVVKAIVLIVLTLVLNGRSQAQTSIDERTTALNNQAVDLARHSKYTEALSVIEDALKLEPDDDILIANKSSFLRSLQRYEEALAVIDAALVNQPNSSHLHYQRLFSLRLLQLGAEARREELLMALDGIVPPRPSLLQNGIPEDEEKPRTHEIRLDGFFLGYHRDSLEFETYLFALPNGRFNLIQPKAKTIFLHGVEPEYGNLSSIPASELRPGDYLVVVGREEKGGFVPRRIIVPARSAAEEKKRGSLFNASALPPLAEKGEPEVPKNVSGNTTFLLANGASLTTQVASFIRDGESTALVTTVSALVEDNKMTLTGLSPREISAVVAQQLSGVTAVKGLEDSDKASTLEASLPIHITSGSPFAGGEIVALPIKNAPASLPLAGANPKRGDVVYLPTWYDGPAWLDQAVVAEVDANHLFLQIGPEGEAVRLPGSAILNQKGEVVGLFVLGTEPYISAVPTEALRRAIRATKASQ